MQFINTEAVGILYRDIYTEALKLLRVISFLTCNKTDKMGKKGNWSAI